MGPVRVAIAGYGLGGEVFHAPLVDSVQGLEVAAIVTSNAGRQTRARKAFPFAQVVPSVDDLWGDIDLLVVATPNRTHLPLALAAFERDIPVVMDKPMAASLAESERMIEAGEARLTVFQNRRLDGDFLTLRALIERGELGQVTRFESRFELGESLPPGWRESPEASEGGGLLLDLGAHLVDQARMLFGHPLRVYAELDRRRLGTEVEDDVFVALEHSGGVRSHLWMSTVAPLHGPRFRVSGTYGSFRSDGLDPQEAQLSDGMRPGDPGYGEKAGLLPGAYQRFYEGVVAWLRDGAPPPVDPRDSLACMRVLDAARRSAETNSVIELEGNT